MNSTRKEFLMAGAVATGGLGFVRSALAQEDTAAASKAVTQLAEFDIIMDREEEAVKALETLCAKVEATEPDTLVYTCHRQTDKPSRIVFFEIFKDQEAAAAHGQQPHLAEFGQGFGTLFQGPVEITRLNRLGGFIR